MALVRAEAIFRKISDLVVVKVIMMIIISHDIRRRARKKRDRVFGVERTKRLFYLGF